jgi:hypothetical protein
MTNIEEGLLSFAEKLEELSEEKIYSIMSIYCSNFDPFTLQKKL